MLILGNNNIGAASVLLSVPGICFAVGPLTCPLTGTVDIFGLYGNNQGNAGNFQCGIYADNAGAPGAHLGHSVSGHLGATDNWYTTVPALPINVVAGQKYWVCFEADSTCSIRHDMGTAVYKNIGYGLWYDPFTTPDGTDPWNISLFADILPSTVPPVLAEVNHLIDDGIGGML